MSFSNGGLVLSGRLISLGAGTEVEPSQYGQGYKAARDGESVAACPFAPSDPEGAEWRRGWLGGEADNRRGAGTFDHTPDEYAAYKASIGWSEEALRDPVLEILGGYDPLPEREPDPSSWPATSAGTITVNITMDVSASKEAFEKLNDALALIDVDALVAQFQGLIGDVEPESPSQRARKRERLLLAEHRRSHRRTNRWGPRPGRRV